MKFSKILFLLFAGLLFAAVVSCEEDTSADESGVEVEGDETTEEDSADPKEDEDGVYVLTQDNFSDFVESTDTVLVEFYAPWCGHCKQLAPEYAAASKELREADPPVSLGKVDATVESTLAQNHDVSGYPTLKFFKNGKSYPYEGPRNKQGIVDYMKKIASPDWKPDPEAVQVLTTANFSEIVNREELMLVEFYAPWCGHCKSLAPKYEKAAKQLKMAPMPIMLAKVDATAETELGEMYKVSGYPTLKIFRNGRPFDYKGPRDEYGIVNYMEGQRGDPAKPVKDLKDLKQALHEEDITVMGVFEDTTDPRYQTFQDALQDMREDYRLTYTTDEAVRKQYKANPGSVLVINAERYYTKFESKWNVLDIKDDTPVEEIQLFIKKHEFPLVGGYEALTERYNKLKTPLCLVFYTVDWSFDHREATQLWRRKVAAIAKDYKGITFAVADEDKSSQMFKDLGLDESGEEINVGIVLDGKKYPMESMEEFDDDHIREFLDQYKKGEIAARVKSQPVPKKQGLVTVVVGKTFDKIVRDTSKDVLIELYAPWCGHCKKLEPVYKELAKKFKPAKNLVIAKMDATANDTPDDFSVGGFPTIYFAPANSKDAPIKYDGGRELDDFVVFLKEKATVSLGSLKDEL